MPTAIQLKYDGGHAEDIRTENTDEIETSDNFDLFTNPHRPTPYIDMVAETMASGITTDYALTDVDAITVSGTTSLVALGRTSSGVNTPAFYRKTSASDITSTWTHYADGVNNVVPRSLTVFRAFGTNDLRAYCLGDTGSQYNLQQFDGGSTVTTIGAISASYASVIPTPFVHPEDNVLYTGAGNVISKYTPTTGVLATDFVASAFVLPSDKIMVSFSNYSTYLAVACRPKNGVGNSRLYLWARDTTLTTVQESIDLGPEQVNIVENIENTLVTISTMAPVGNYANILQNKIIVKVYNGGAMRVVKEITISSTLGTAANIIKRKVGNKLYFGFPNDTSIYVFGINKSGRYFVSHNRALPSGTTNLTNINLIGDFMFVAFDTQAQSNQFQRTIALSESQNYTTTSSIKTTKNPGMTPADKSVLKELKSVQWMVRCPSSLGTTTIKYAADSGTLVTLATQTNVSGDTVIEAVNESTDVELLQAREYSFQIETTGGAQPISLRYRYENLEQLT